MTVHTIADWHGFDGLREQWTELLAESDADCVFLTWEWLNTWWRHLGGRRRLSILAVREGDRLMAIAPLGLSPSPLGGLLGPGRLEFLGSGHVGSDYLDVIVRRGHAVDVVDALAAHLGARHTMLRLSQLDAVKASAWQLGTALSGLGWTDARAVTSACPFIDLRSLDWRRYLESRSSSLRYDFGRKLRGLERHGKVTLDAASTQLARHQALDRLIAFHLDRWAPRGGSDGFHRADLRAFHEEFSQSALNRGWLRLLTLSVGRTPVADFYCLRYRHSMMFYQSGFDPRWTASGVGVVAMGLAIKSAIDEGADTYDLLHGEERYKFRWAGQARSLARLELYPANVVGTIRRHTVEIARAARRAARSLRSSPSVTHVTGHS